MLLPSPPTYDTASLPYTSLLFRTNNFHFIFAQQQLVKKDDVGELLGKAHNNVGKYLA